jgi:hypothetical protein
VSFSQTLKSAPNHVYHVGISLPEFFQNFWSQTECRAFLIFKGIFQKYKGKIPPTLFFKKGDEKRMQFSMHAKQIMMGVYQNTWTSGMMS